MLTLALVAIITVLAAAVIATLQAGAPAPLGAAPPDPLVEPRRPGLRGLIVFVATVIAVSFLLATPAGAAGDTMRVSTNSIIQLDVTLLSFITGSFMPLLTGLATKLNASSKVKAIVNLVLAVLAGVVSAFVAGDGSLTVLEVAAAAIAAYLSAGVAYQNFWKPTQVAASVARATENAGVG